VEITKGVDGRHAWNRILSIIGFFTLSSGFIKEASTKHLEWMDYIGYSIGMSIVYSPVLSIKILALLRNQQTIAAPDVVHKLPKIESEDGIQ
jgi:hypothetical protein